jgi:membrane protein
VGYLPAKSIDKLLVADVIGAIRCAEESQFLSVDAIPLPEGVAEQAHLIDLAADNILSDKTIGDLTKLL